MRRIRLISLSVTALAAVLIVVLLLVLRLGLPTRKGWPPERENEVSLYEEEFIEVMEDGGSGQQSAVSGQRSAVGGQRSADGDQRSAVSGERSVGSEERSAEEQTRNRVSSEVKNRFGAATAPSSPTQSEQSTTSSPTNEGTRDEDRGTGIEGVGSGTVGGGWKMPSYQKIRSTSVGSIIVQLTLDRFGNITALDFVGGVPPAYSDASLRAAVEKEIRARRFTRTDDDAPDRATARITYTFQ